MTQVERQGRELSFNPERSDLPSFRIGKYFPNHHNPLTNAIIAGWNLMTRSGPVTEKSLHDRNGIELRYVASEDETVVDMGEKAALDLKIDLKDTDFVMVSTSFPCGVNVASEIAKRLNLPKVIPHSPKHVRDIYAACSGFVRGLDYLKEHEETFKGKKILFIASEKYSPYLADLEKGGIETDPSMAQTLFSDGAIAFHFTYGEDIEILAASTHVFPHIRNILKMPVDTQVMVEPYTYEPVEISERYFQQQGPKVFETVAKEIPIFTLNWLVNLGFDPSRIDHIVPHQGSGRMVSKLQEQFEKVFNRQLQVTNDAREGNFSSGSIPKALAKLEENGQIDPKKVILLVGFGAGAGLLASIAAVVIKGARKR